MIKQAVLMCGGNGIRLLPFTYLKPKPLLPYGEITVIEHIVKRLSEHGIEEIFILISEQHDFNVCYKYQEKYNVKIHIINESHKHGTIGGISIIKDQLKNDFIIMNGDIVTQLNFKKLFKQHIEQKSDVTICTKKLKHTLPYGIIKTYKDKVLSIIEKPTYFYNAIAGINIINSDTLKHLTNEYMDINVFFDKIRTNNVFTNKIGIYQIKEKWHDIGQIKDYENAIELLRK